MHEVAVGGEAADIDEGFEGIVEKGNGGFEVGFGEEGLGTED